MGPDGLQQTARYSGGWSNKSVSGVEGKVHVRGTVSQSSDKDEGYIVELVIPRSAIQATGSLARCTLVLYNQDAGASRIEDGLDSANLSQPNTWFKIRM